MKKALSLVLTLVLVFALLPAPTTVNAAQLGDSPYYCVNFVDMGEGIPNVYWMPYFWAGPIEDENDEPYVTCYGTRDPEAIAEVLKNDFGSRPKGSRYFQLCLAQTAFHSLVENNVYFDKAVKFTRDWVDNFLQFYKGMNGLIDGIIIDVEYIYNHAYYLYDGSEEDVHIFQDIVNDPRYETQLRPLLEEYGFKFYEDVDDVKSEIWCINTKDSSIKGHGECYDIWNHVTDIIEKEAFNEAVLEPLLKYYPDGNVSDYCSEAQDPWFRASDTHGREPAFITDSAGNVANSKLYSGNPENAYYGWGTPVYNNPASYNDAQFQPTPFNVFMYDVNNFKNMYASTDDGKIDVWHANYDYGLTVTGYPTTYCGTPYYSEVMLHVGLLNPQVYLGYIIYDVETACEVVSDIMLELTRMVGASDRKPLTTKSSWNGSYVLSGMYAAGRNVWRITPDTDVVSLRDFKISNNGEDPTFYVDGLTITFPGGKIVSDGTIREVGTCGYWIETAKDVEPIITASDDRYRNNPSLLENFEGYKAGASFTSGSALPKATWNVSGTANVQNVGNNKVLALTNNVILENVKLPENITAGDAYAKQQGWEVTVTLPQDLNDFDSMKLLSYGQYDRGIRLADGKVYYHDGSALQEIAGVSLVGGGTYTFRRELDFRTSGDFKCTYSIYDESGKLLGEAKNVRTQSVSLPVESITISVSGADSAVLIDDYKLYPTGVATTLALYDTEIGRKASNVNESRTEDTVYRFTWLNGTNEENVAYIYDELTGNVFEKVTLKAGQDGFAVGTVEVNAGQKVQIAVRLEAETSTDTPPVNDPTNENPPVEDPENDNTEATEDTVDVTEPATTATTADTEPSTEASTDSNQATDPSELPDNANNRKKMSVGAIVGIIISAVIFAGAIAAVAIIVLKKKNIIFLNKEASSAEDISQAEEATEQLEDEQNPADNASESEN